MMIVPWSLVASIAVIAPAAGCPRLKFEPREKITAENLERLETVLAWQVRAFVPGPHPADPIKQIAVDGQRGILYLHCHRWGYGLEMLKSAGIFAYDMRSGKEIRHIRVPTLLDMSGSAKNASGRCVFDFDNQVAWYACRLEDSDVVLRLDLKKDQPRIVARDLEFADEAHPGDGRLLLATADRWHQSRRVCWFDPATEKLDQPVELPREVEWTWIGAAGNHIVGLTSDHPDDNGGSDPNKPMVWQVLKIDNERIEVLANRPLDYSKEQPGTWTYFTLDPVNNRLLTLSAPLEHPDAVKQPLEVYELPTLNVICNGGSFYSTRIVPVAKSRLIMLLQGRSSTEVLILDERACKVRKQLDFASAGVSQTAETWTPFSDASGQFVGVYGDRGVVLFAVRPPGQEGQ